MPATKRVALLLSQDIGYSRAVLRCIREYAIARPQRVFHDAPPTCEVLAPLRRWKPQPVHRFIAPVRVVARQSTDTLAVEDEVVASVLRLIHERATAGLTIGDIARRLSISRRQIERRIREQLGVTLLEEIRRVRVERAKHLLAETDLDMPQVAAGAGFSDARRLSLVFKEQTGQSPSQFRRALHDRPGGD